MSEEIEEIEVTVESAATTETVETTSLGAALEVSDEESDTSPMVGTVVEPIGIAPSMSPVETTEEPERKPAPGTELEPVDTVDSMNTTEHETLFSLCDNEKSIAQHVSEMFDIQPRKKVPPQTPSQKKFSRIRNFVQKLNEEYLATLFENDQRHKAEIKSLREELEAQEEKNEALQYKVKSVEASALEQAMLVKRASEKIKKLEASEENHKQYIKMAGEKISMLESAEKKRAKQTNEKIKSMEAREEKIVALAKKAAIKIKELEGFKKKQTSNAKKAVGSIQLLKHMLLAKHGELEDVKEKAMRAFDALAEEMAAITNQRVELQSALAEAKKQYKNERELRKADQKKISSLRKMIEQYDGIESTWSDLSQALSEEESVIPLCIYRDARANSQEEFIEVCDKVLENIPEDIKNKYGQVGFFNTNNYHFPVLALSPFDVPPGALREEWLEKANSSLGVYYYGQEDASMAYDMIPAESFISYEDGAAKNFHIVPAEIIEKNTEGIDLLPIEQVYAAGIKKVNVEARSEPADRFHPLKEFEEEFGVKRSAAEGQIKVDVEAMSEALRTRFKEVIGAQTGEESNAEKAELVNTLGKIEEAELLDMTPKKKKKVPTLNVDTDCDASCVSVDTESCAETLTSLEEQMRSFMHELVANSRTAARQAKRAPMLEETRDMPESAEHCAESRDDVADSKPASSLVQQRLKMFGGQPAKVNTRATVIPDSSAKDVMKMWKMKEAGQSVSTTPRKNNTTPVGSFSFAETVTKDERPEINAVESQTGSTRCVTIPKNILKKIEAGELLTDHEREILQGIQKFNDLKAAASSASESVEGHVIVELSSTVSGVTTEGVNADDKQHIEVSAE